MKLSTLLALVTVLAACGRGRARPTIKPLPVADGVPPLLAPGPHSPRLASYTIDARYDAVTHRIAAGQRLVWKNSGAKEVSALPFHLYMNAFKNESSVFMKESGGRHREARASATGWGWIDVKTAAVDGGPDLRARARYLGPDETVLEVPLDTPVAPGATVSVDMEFTVQLPEVFARTGYKGDFAMVGQWFPKIGVRVGPPDDERWHCEPFHLNSEFFADFGTYDVKLTVPETHVVAATGVLTAAEDLGDGTRLLTYRAEDVHDFSWMADPYMEVLSAKAKTSGGAVEVRVYYRAEQRAFAERHLVAGVGAIEGFSRRYYPYPWAIMSIIDPPPDAAMGAGGMEYPTLVTTAGDLALLPPSIREPEFVTVHEVGHNWFQGLLASNEVDEAWLDEGLNEYVDGLVMIELYGETTSVVDLWGWTGEYYQLRRALAGLDTLPDPIAARSFDFADNSSYGRATYIKTALALRTLEHIMGSERFAAALHAYATEFAFKHPTGADFFAVLERELGEDLDWFLVPAFQQLGGVDFRVRDIRCRVRHDPRGVFGDGEGRREVGRDDAPDTDVQVCEALVVNLGVVRSPVEVEFRFSDGAGVRERWDEKTAWRRFTFERTARLDEVIIDPDRRIVLDDRPLDAGWRELPDTRASRRAAARGQFWTQTLMQLVGL